MEQARRVVGLAVNSGHWDGYEIWRDWPAQGLASGRDAVKINGEMVRVSGEGHGRSVLLSRAGGVKMLKLGDENSL